uniref:SGNH hydrolase-type esterase domain-containing protein n=1 Tax=Labrus bergylta TaxID=56723 RepID=A0A3Q3GIJ6_9LABR
MVGTRDSIIRNVQSGSTITFCFPGATVRDITDRNIELLAKKPENTKVIIQVGTNDIRKQQSELLKTDVVHLFTTLKRSVIDIHMSGPIPSCGRGCGLLALHTWLSSACNGLSHQLCMQNYRHSCKTCWTAVW